MLGRWFESKPDPLLEALFERASDGFLVCGGDGKVLSCNPAAAQMLGDEPAAVEGRHVSELFEQRQSERFSLHTGGAMTRGGAAAPRPVDLHLTEYAGSSGTHVLVRVRDASERADTQERLKQLANFDSLTGLPNRSLFRDRLGQAMAPSRSATAARWR
jgi:diguanylate cyclase